jgi:arylsulfatase A-like enzyme
MITAMDEAIGEMTTKLKQLGLYENTIIVFLGDNGAPPQMFNSNLPFNGFKATEYEGGTRTVAFVHSPLIPQQR